MFITTDVNFEVNFEVNLNIEWVYFWLYTHLILYTYTFFAHVSSGLDNYSGSTFLSFILLLKYDFTYCTADFLGHAASWKVLTEYLQN